MKIVTADEMRKIDSGTIKLGVPSEVLMENAASALCERVLELSAQTVQIFCGKGQNGGDGFALARRLYCCGILVEVVLLCDDTELCGAALTNYEADKNMGIKIKRFDENTKIYASVVIDAILGTGIRGEVCGEIKKAIELINASEAYVISADIPSGISADTGRVCGCAVCADETYTFGYVKLGLLSPLSADYVGDITVCDISVLPHLAKDVRRRILLRDKAMEPFEPMCTAAHKGDRGHTLVIGGTPGMTGAVYLAGRAAEMTGSGTITLAVPPAIKNIIMSKIVCAMCTDIDENLAEKVKKADAIVVGNGMGKDDRARKAVYDVLDKAEKTVVLDADALNIVSENPDILKKSSANIIITPHIGEMSRLTGQDTSYITENRVEVAENFAQKYNVCVVLKGAYTVVAAPHTDTYINISGNCGMAKGGSGDALAGMIAGISARGTDYISAALAGVFVHGSAGDEALGMYGEHSMTAENIIECIHKVLTAK